MKKFVYFVKWLFCRECREINQKNEKERQDLRDQLKKVQEMRVFEAVACGFFFFILLTVIAWMASNV